MFHLSTRCLVVDYIQTENKVQWMNKATYSGRCNQTDRTYQSHIQDTVHSHHHKRHKLIFSIFISLQTFTIFPFFVLFFSFLLFLKSLPFFYFFLKSCPVLIFFLTHFQSRSIFLLAISNKPSRPDNFKAAEKEKKLIRHA